MRGDNKKENQFSTGIASLMFTPTKNIGEVVGDGLKGFGLLADNHRAKVQKEEAFNFNMQQQKVKADQNNKLFDYTMKRKPIEDNQKDLDFTVRHDRIKEKVGDNHRLAKLMSSGLDYKTFTSKYGEFSTPTAIKYAKDFTNKNKKLMSESLQQEQWNKVINDERFLNSDKSFNFEKATNHVASRIRKGLTPPHIGIAIIDGLHQKGGYGIYSKPKARISQPKEITLYEYGKQHPDFATQQMESTNYTPTEASKAYRENIKSLPMEERQAYRESHPFVEFRKAYNDEKKMASGVSTTHQINSSINKFSEKYKVDDFANYDFYNGVARGEITPKDVAELQRVMANSKQAQILDSQMSKKASSLQEIAGQANRFAVYASSGNVDTNIFKSKVDEIEAYIPGLEYSEEEIQNEEFRRDFLNLGSTLLKLQSGLAVSNAELKNFEKSLGTLDRNKKSNFIGIKQKLTDIKNSFEGIKTIDPQYFNIKYGATLNGLNRSIGFIDDAIRHQGEHIIETQKEDSPIGYQFSINPFKWF